ncbi:hypothetical protein K469DRAFT_746890 [Zopfia rhizophila CBS 207.26]|uniref:Uncharacterized protein n=1 Tax=Zopfia rhizophila CBS 207.26 TaxID=1314779 RepID=A0A6A6EKE0_9PEZI|nr:hypothetical protein K469DRAFT_746890 [Zopfia rhizophila CBS 207.26]
MAYSKRYVEESVEKSVVLGPEECEWRRTVNSASSVTQYWRELIAEADATVLRDKRRKDPKNFAKWRLKFLSHTHQRGQGPVSEISQLLGRRRAHELRWARLSRREHDRARKKCDTLAPDANRLASNQVHRPGHVGQVQQVLPLPAEFEIDEEDFVAPANNDTSDTASHTSETHLQTCPDAYSSEPIFPHDPARAEPLTYMITGSPDGTIRLWHVPSGRCIHRFFGHVEGVWSLAADTLRLVSGTEDKLIKI